MPLTTEEIDQILKLIDESPFDELHLEMGNLKLTVGKGGARIPSQPRQPTAPEPGGPGVAQEPLIPRRTHSIHKPSVQLPAQAEKPKTGLFDSTPYERDGLLPVKAPTLGIFYRSPKPGAPPFVEVGKSVEDHDTVCLIEVMKLFNAVKAGVKGHIVKICAENNRMVEYNQILFLIKPETRTGEISTP
jgi:acetyl-CoA carboxylase biotin carboxyl carrier protein